MTSSSLGLVIDGAKDGTYIRVRVILCALKKMKYALTNFNIFFQLGSMFTTDTISNAIYGIQNNTFLDRNSLFAQLAKEVFSGNFFDNMRTMVNALFPEICSIIGVR